eukprot:569791_1
MAAVKRNHYSFLFGVLCLIFTTQYMVLLFLIPHNVFIYFPDHESVIPVYLSPPPESCPNITNIYDNSKVLPPNKTQQLHVKYDLPLYLFSTGGSGNTWMRVLLEYITGISTGAAFGDPKYNTIFNRDMICKNNVLVCKAHPIWFYVQVPPVEWKPDGLWEGKKTEHIHEADGLVWIIRNPWYCMWSLYQLRASDYVHSGEIDISDFDADHFYMDVYMGAREISLVEKWKLQFTIAEVLLSDAKRKWNNDTSRIVQIKYEKIVNEPTRVNEMLKVINHLYVNVSSNGLRLPGNKTISYDELINRIECAFMYKTNEGTFHRSHNDTGRSIVTLEYAYMALGEEKICKIWHSLKEHAQPLGYTQLFVDKFRCEEKGYWHNITDIDSVKNPNMTRFKKAKEIYERERQLRKRQNMQKKQKGVIHAG